jgi:hypothetical protein
VGGAVVGREGELAAVQQLLDDVGAGPATLVLWGEAGIGKTTIWAAGVVAAGLRGDAVLQCRPAVAELRLTYAGLMDLLVHVDETVFGANGGFPVAVRQPDRHARKSQRVFGELPSQHSGRDKLAERKRGRVQCVVAVALLGAEDVVEFPRNAAAAYALGLAAATGDAAWSVGGSGRRAARQASWAPLPPTPGRPRTQCQAMTICVPHVNAGINALASTAPAPSNTRPIPLCRSSSMSANRVGPGHHARH